MPITVTAPTSGRPRAISTRTPEGMPVRAAMVGAAVTVTGKGDETCSEHLVDEGRDVVSSAIQDRADQLDANALEVAAGALDLGHARAVGLDDEQRGVEPRTQDGGVAVDVGRWQVEDHEVEVLAQ